MHRIFLPDRIFLLNHNKERSMMTMSPGLSIKLYNISLIELSLSINTHTLLNTQILKISEYTQ